MSQRYAVIIPVGPDPRELDRLGALVAELARHADPYQVRLIVIDDAPPGRTLAPAWPEPVLLRTALWEHRTAPDTLSAHVAGTLEGLTRARGLEFAVKLDADAAVIAPFADALADAFADPQLGVIGSYDRMSSGAARDWSVWERPLARATHRLAVNRSGTRLAIHYRPAAQRRVIRDTLASAESVAPRGAHCLGGAYAVSATFLQRAALDWRPWVRTQLGEDIVVGLLCSQARLTMRSLTAGGEPFAVAWRGLPAPPAQLRAAGHGIVHSVRDEDPAQETLRRRALQGEDGA
jgi:hypothetical protein